MLLDGNPLLTKHSKVAQRHMLAEKVPDLANLVIGALFLGQFFSDRPFSLVLVLSGLAAWTALIGFALSMAGIEDSQR